MSNSEEVTSQNIGPHSTQPNEAHKLDGKNYLQWAQSVKLFICGRGKLGYITGDLPAPLFNDPTYKELDLYLDTTPLCANCTTIQRQQLEKERVFEFLTGLNNNLDEVRGCLVGRAPFPDTEEARRRVMLTTPDLQPIESSALVSKSGPPPLGRSTPDPRPNHKGDQPWCDHCQRHGHTRSTCWVIHGKPPNWTPRRQNERKAYQTQTESTNDQNSAGTPSFNKEQLAHLYTLLSQSSINPSSGPETHSASVAHSGNFSSTSNTPWIIDSGATDHMTGLPHLFDTYSPCSTKSSVTIANGTHSPIVGIGTIKLSADLILKSDVSSGRMIGSARVRNGLYFFERQHPVNELSSLLRLGSSSISNSCSSSSFVSNSHTRILFPHKKYTPSNPFSLIHSDIWGPSKVNTSHELSSNDPNTNGVAERKNCHLLEVARALMFTMHVPKHLWGDAILTAAYLINRLPSRPLQFKTPYSVLQSLHPHISTNTLPVKVFGCTAFVHVHSHHRSKFDPRAIKTVFLGYSPTQKGYRCYCPIAKKTFISCDDTFFEDTPYFTPTSLQGESNHHQQEAQWSWGLELPLTTFPFTSSTPLSSEPDI
ncbi:uncharacterized protein LOC133779323 [Humulus lupulus]|uniref:uncharacterized protein LOC133779323 n=1 Tax=Humulus lupulus TaxID=3486 RepID=UPI002B4169AC|nr:uncharacterized protein LOC133779323 [Humulus lupulus]